MELLVGIDSDLLIQASGVLPAVLGSQAVQRMKRVVERVPGAHRVYKWMTSRTGEGHVYQIESGPLAGARWRRHNAFPYWYHMGVYEPEVSECIVENLHEGDTFWDIGAHAGYHTLLAARAVGPNGRVLAVEPDRDVCELMHGQLELNGIVNTTIVPAAVAAEAGESAFCVQENDSRTSALAAIRDPAGGNGNSRRTLVNCITLDSLAGDSPPPTLLKMDVERAEALILPAARSFFEGPNRPRAMILGYHGIPTGRKCVQWMHQYGYRAVPATGLVTEVAPRNGTILWHDSRRLH